MAFPREAFRALVSDVAGGVAATWENRPLGFQAGVRILLKLTSSNEVGWDDSAESFDDATQTRKVSSIERRLIRVQIRVDSFDPTKDALDVAETIRTRLYLESSRLALEGMTDALSYLGSNALSLTEWLVDGRACESAILEIKLYRLRLEAQTDNEGGWIETFEVDGTPTV